MMHCPVCDAALAGDLVAVIDLYEDAARPAALQLPAVLYVDNARFALLAWCEHCESIHATAGRFLAADRWEPLGPLHRWSEPRLVKRLLDRLPRRGGGIIFRSLTSSRGG